MSRRNVRVDDGAKITAKRKRQRNMWLLRKWVNKYYPELRQENEQDLGIGFTPGEQKKEESNWFANLVGTYALVYKDRRDKDHELKLKALEANIEKAKMGSDLYTGDPRSYVPSPSNVPLYLMFAGVLFGAFVLLKTAGGK